MMKIKFKKPGFYQHNYPADSIVMVEENFGKYAIGMGDAIEADPSAKVTDPVPYTMKPRTTPIEDAMVAIADDIRLSRQIPQKVVVAEKAKT